MKLCGCRVRGGAAESVGGCLWDALSSAVTGDVSYEQTLKSQSLTEQGCAPAPTACACLTLKVICQDENPDCP